VCLAKKFLQNFSDSFPSDGVGAADFLWENRPSLPQVVHILIDPTTFGVGVEGRTASAVLP
jgi:hypothetical protein